MYLSAVSRELILCWVRMQRLEVNHFPVLRYILLLFSAKALFFFFFLDPFGVESRILPSCLQIRVWRRIRKQMCLLCKIKTVREQGNRKDHKPERPVQTNFHRTPPLSNITVSNKYYIIRTNDYLLIHDSEGQPLLNSTLWKLLNPLCSIYYITKCKDSKKLWMKGAEKPVTMKLIKYIYTLLYTENWQKMAGNQTWHEKPLLQS